MLSYTALRNKYGVITNNTNSTNLTNGDGWINDGQRIFMAETNGDYTEATAMDTTVATQQNYKLPYNYEKMNSVTVTVGSFKYPVKEVVDRQSWDNLNLSTNVSASYPQYYFIDAGQIYFWPIPSASSYTITFSYKQIVRDLSNADFTTGTVTLTNASTTVTHSGTSFTAAMVGRYIKSNTDGYWYKIATFSSTSVLLLEKKWQGTTAAGLNYTIGEMPLIPEAYHPSLVDYAVSEYWNLQGETTRALVYQRKWDAAIKKGRIDAANKTSSVVITDSIGGDEYYPTNPNLTIHL